MVVPDLPPAAHEDVGLDLGRRFPRRHVLLLGLRVGGADAFGFLDVPVEDVEHLVRVHGVGLWSDKD